MPASSASLPWWLATTGCSPPPASRSIPGRLAFLVLSSCPQRALLTALDLLFLLAALALAVHACLSRRHTGGGLDQPAREPLLAKPTTTDTDPLPRRRNSFRHALALEVSGLQAAAALLLLVLAVLRHRGSALWVAVECAFLAAHAIAHLAAALVVAAEKAAARVVHPVHLRLFWLCTGALAVVLSGCAAARFAAGEQVLPDDPLAVAWLALSLPLLYFSVTGSTGLDAVVATAASGTEQTYATASWLSLATFAWINPLIAKGYSQALAADQVPPVAPDDTAEAAYELFVSNWSAPALGSKAERPVITALLRSFWPQFLFTALLGLAHLAVMYVGPSLVDRFVEFLLRTCY